MARVVRTVASPLHTCMPFRPTIGSVSAPSIKVTGVIRSFRWGRFFAVVFRLNDSFFMYFDPLLIDRGGW